jgi:hypothetical protein
VELLREAFIKGIMPSSQHEHDPDRREMRGCHVFVLPVEPVALQVGKRKIDLQDKHLDIVLTELIAGSR